MSRPKSEPQSEKKALLNVSACANPDAAIGVPGEYFVRQWVPHRIKAPQRPEMIPGRPGGCRES